MDFYYDPKIKAAVDRESGIVVRPSGRFSGDAGERYFLIDPNSDARTYDGIGIFEFGADYLREKIETIGNDGRPVVHTIRLGMEVYAVEGAFSRYMPHDENRVEKIKNIVSSALLVGLEYYSPGQTFKILFR